MPHPAKPYRIVSDGTPNGTHIYDPDGKKLGMIVELKIQVNTTECSARVTQLLRPVELDIQIPTDKMKAKKTRFTAKKKTPPKQSLLPN